LLLPWWLPWLLLPPPSAPPRWRGLGKAAKDAAEFDGAP
jgi:hypothetical protein